MIRTNLSTRPFYNERAVSLWLLVFLFVVVAATVFNTTRVLRYSHSDTELGTTASQDEWDDYEWKYCRSIERYAREQLDDPDNPWMLERIRRWRDGYLRWGRDTLGFGVYLFQGPMRT